MSVEEAVDSLFPALTQSDLLWLAGWLEGEGCFTQYRNYRTKCPVVMAGCTDADVIERVGRLFNVGWRSMPKRRATWKQMYYVRLTAAKAARMMEIESRKTLVGNRYRDYNGRFTTDKAVVQ